MTPVPAAVTVMIDMACTMRPNAFLLIHVPSDVTTRQLKRLKARLLFIDVDVPKQVVARGQVEVPERDLERLDDQLTKHA